jgi:hypothetical protein
MSCPNCPPGYDCETGNYATGADIDQLIEASSLGTPAAKALRDSVPIETARTVVARSREIGEES